MTPATHQLIIEYDGSGFEGWQKQPRKRTVQGELEKALRRLYGIAIPIVGSGRTDKGVHALGQSAHFRAPGRFKPATLIRALNAHLPEDIAVLDARLRPDDFHARYSTTAKIYEYRLSTRPVRPALLRRHVGHEPRGPLDETIMHRAANLFIGEHCFKAFSAKDPSRDQEDEGFVRRVETIEIKRLSDEQWVFRIKADGFLYKMARLLVRAIVDAGRGRIALETIADLLRAPRRGVIAPPMPPEGLHLVSVEYGA